MNHAIKNYHLHEMECKHVNYKNYLHCIYTGDITQYNTMC